MPRRSLTLGLAITGIILLAATGCSTLVERKSPLPRVETTALALVPVSRESEPWWVDRHAQCKAAAEKGGVDVLFIGDSITQGWEEDGAAIWKNEIAPLRAANFGFSGDRTEHVLWRLDNGELPQALQPKAAVIMIGTNNTGHNMEKPEAIAAGIGAIVDRLHKHNPKTRILLLGIFPRGAKPNDKMRLNNDAVNALLAKLEGYKRVHYLDIGPKYLQADGTLPQEIMPDLLHPSLKGYQIWADNVVPEIERTLRK